MFFNIIKRNSRKARRENGIYFFSLVISIIAFYVLLSLGEQDVINYLKTIESDAVKKLLILIIPVLYIVSLFFVFFLVYFANRYQLYRRSHEFGIYLMMGMKRSRLFGMIMGETLWSGFIALIIGIPISLFLTEMISLATSKLVGMGIIGHRFRISWTGLILTVIGFIVVQLFAVAILSFKMAKREPIDLLNDKSEKTQKVPSQKKSITYSIIGIVLLCSAYALAICFLKPIKPFIFELVLVIGISGTFILFRGLGGLIGGWIKQKGKSSTGLFIFTGRQLQENVLNQWKSLAVSSLLILMAMVCFAYGISTSLNTGSIETKTCDFTFIGNEKEIIAALESEELKPYIRKYYPMKQGNFRISDSESFEEGTSKDSFSWFGLEASISNQKESSEKENLVRDLSHIGKPRFISLTSYNTLLRFADKDPIVLEKNEMAMYSDPELPYYHDILKEALESNLKVRIDGQEYVLESNLYTDNIVADRALTLWCALIVPEDIFDAYTWAPEGSYMWNMVLDQDFVDDKGLMQAMAEVEELLSTTGLEYESYLSSMGRRLFYAVAGSYTTLYLGIMFLIIANTVLGLKFLVQQRNTRHRYYTVFALGGSIKSLCKSARVQIWWYFGLAISLALISSIFGIMSILGTFGIGGQITQSSTMIWIVGIILVLITAFEFFYIWIIQKKSDEEIKKLKKIG